MVIALLSQYQNLWSLWSLRIKRFSKDKIETSEEFAVSLTESTNRIKSCEEKNGGVRQPPDIITENTKTEWGMQEDHGKILTHSLQDCMKNSINIS